ncbi:MAG: hypothetical protein B7Y49_01455 [Sphingomonas sp. 28-62-11]|nr:MAG: hypothetical protein B7Y49_01455 [Sphingomonas sp. 28-62-11]
MTWIDSEPRRRGNAGGVKVRTTDGKVTIVRRAILGTLILWAPLALPAQAGQRPLAAQAKVAAKAPSASAPADPVATGVTPIGNPGDWFPLDSYPPEARIASQEGRTQFSLDIDAAGRITGCNIIESSGSDLLDSTTCSQLIANGQFKPALDSNGNPVKGTWKSAMRWRLSDVEDAKE